MARSLQMTSASETPSVPAAQGDRLLIASILVLLLLTAWLSFVKGTVLPVRYFEQQDRPVLYLALAAMLCLCFFARREPQPAPAQASWAMTSARLWLSVLGLLALLLWWGTYGIMSNYALTRDEHMVLFDMAVFAKGHLAEPVSDFWRPYALQLVPAFLLQSHEPMGLVSSYLPGNAMLRLAFSKIADPALFNPLLAALGGIALFDIARRELGASNSAVAVVMLIYVTSTQMLVNAMTVFAMTPHMALNLIWLAAFLRGGKAGHAVAIFVGAWACGLHQLVFHPLFVGPFILWRAAQGQWRIVALYAVAYAAICLGWMLYPGFAAQWTTYPGAVTEHVDFFRDRVFPLLFEREPFTAVIIGFNAARFLAWQNLALLPLAFAAWPAIRRNQGIAAPLAAGFVGTFILVSIVLPYQAHGWGYRYLHNVLGSCALIGGYGWIALRDRVVFRARMVTILTALTIMVTAPWLIYQTYRFSAPYVTLDQLGRAQASPFVLVDNFDPALMIDQARNEPNISNRPVRLASRGMTSKQLAALCDRGTVTVIRREDMHRAGMGLQSRVASPRFDRLVTPFRASGCIRNASWEGLPR